MIPKSGITFSRSQGYADQPITVPCGNCDGCMLARASSWAVRATHELASMNGKKRKHADSIFLTLTYDDDNLPSDNLVSVEEAQKFLKRLRSKIQTPIRYMLCGEYGSQTYRPHYHALIFGYRPPDAKQIRTTKNGNIFNSSELSKSWELGLHEFGSVTPASAGYVARYTSKKMFDRGSKGAEFLLASRRPALGIPWLETHFHEVYPVDGVRLAGKLYRPPVAYDRWLEKNHPRLYRKVWNQRIARTAEPKFQEETSFQKLVAKETITRARIRALKRGL